MWDPDSAFPVFSFRDDGKSVIRHRPGKVLLPTFKLEDSSRDGLRDKVVDRIRELCLAAGFPGRACVLIVGDSVCSSPDGVVCSVELGIGFTWDYAEGEDGLRCSVLACDVPAVLEEDDFSDVDLRKLEDVRVVMSVMSV